MMRVVPTALLTSHEAVRVRNEDESDVLYGRLISTKMYCWVFQTIHDDQNPSFSASSVLKLHFSSWDDRKESRTVKIVDRVVVDINGFWF